MPWLGQRGGRGGAALEKLARPINNGWAGWNQRWPAGFYKTSSAQDPSQGMCLQTIPPKQPCPSWGGKMPSSETIHFLPMGDQKGKESKHYLEERREPGRGV